MIDIHVGFCSLPVAKVLDVGCLHFTRKTTNKCVLNMLSMTTNPCFSFIIEFLNANPHFSFFTVSCVCKISTGGRGTFAQTRSVRYIVLHASTRFIYGSGSTSQCNPTCYLPYCCSYTWACNWKVFTLKDMWYC